MFYRLVFSTLLFLAYAQAFAQHYYGRIAGTVINESTYKQTPALIKLTQLGNNTFHYQDTTADIYIDSLPLNTYYTISIQAIGYSSVIIDSIYLTQAIPHIQLHTITIHKVIAPYTQATVYAAKPVLESKDGNITYNVGDLPIANTSSATELLKTAPLVTIDADGKVLLKGKEVKILVDEKPIELNSKQLQDMLEAMPGSFIEKIEILNNPPPQFANERGGVINIVTKKGKVGRTARATVYYGTRGELGANASLGYKKNKLNTLLTVGTSTNQYLGGSTSRRTNYYKDSTNYFNTHSSYHNTNTRPNFRWSTDYDINKKNALNLVLTYNNNQANNNATTEYTNTNQYLQPYKISDRNTEVATHNYTTGISASYILRNATKTSVLRITSAYNNTNNKQQKQFYQQFYTGNKQPTGVDSTQTQDIHLQGYNASIRLNYDKVLDSGNIIINTGLNYVVTDNDNVLNTFFLKKPERTLLYNTTLSNQYNFALRIPSARVAVKYTITPKHNITLGTQAEYTQLQFILNTTKANNTYLSWLPFATYIAKWNTRNTVTLTYKKSIQRPGINETNPAIDYTDPFNIRYGNTQLQPQYAHSVDAIFGQVHPKLYWNTAIGYNALSNVYAAIRTLQANGTTATTYENISNRKEYEASAWAGYTLAKNSRINYSVGYTYNSYSKYDKEKLRYRNGANITSTLNGNYAPSDVWQYNAACTYNRFANAQGTVRSNVSMNLSVAHKLYRKQFTVTVSTIDPLVQQRNISTTVGNNFAIDYNSFTRTRNYKLAVAYNFIKKPKAKTKALPKPKNT